VRRTRARSLALLATADLTYGEVGATRAVRLPVGYDHVLRDVVVGSGSDAFEAAADGLFAWRMHRAAGLATVGPAVRAVSGTTVVFRAGPAWLHLDIPCRVVYAVEEADRRGFAYGTLPGHPERGEEAFEVRLDDAGAVHFRICAFSKPASLLARAGGPLTRRAQSYATDRYVNALRNLAHPPT
jgi:uncharacterized protein (UPF0548 family)